MKHLLTGCWQSVTNSYTSVPWYKMKPGMIIFTLLSSAPHSLRLQEGDRLPAWERELQKCDPPCPPPDPQGQSLQMSAALCSPQAHHRSILSPASWLLGYTRTCTCDTEDLYLVETVSICISTWLLPCQEQRLFIWTVWNKHSRIWQTWFGSWLTI